MIVLRIIELYHREIYSLGRSRPRRYVLGDVLSSIADFGYRRPWDPYYGIRLSLFLGRYILGCLESSLF